MLGTLNGALEVRGVTLPNEAIAAEARGINELVDGMIRLSSIEIHYRLVVPSESRATVERAFAKHQDKCPTAVSLAPAVRISWTADIIDGA